MTELLEQAFHMASNLWAYLKRLYAIDAFCDTTNLEHIKNGYFGRSGNGIVPEGWGEDYLRRLAV